MAETELKYVIFFIAKLSFIDELQFIKHTFWNPYLDNRTLKFINFTLFNHIIYI